MSRTVNYTAATFAAIYNRFDKETGQFIITSDEEIEFVEKGDALNFKCGLPEGLDGHTWTPDLEDISRLETKLIALRREILSSRPKNGSIPADPARIYKYFDELRNWVAYAYWLSDAEGLGKAEKNALGNVLFNFIQISD